MRRLAGGIPRAFMSHRTPDGARYGRYVRAKLVALGTLPPDAMETLRIAGRLVVEIAQLEGDYDRLRSQKRMRDMRAIDRRLNFKRRELRTTEEQLRAAAARPPADGVLFVGEDSSR